MPDITENWDPNDWERYVFGLLQDRHGPLNVNKVPARHKGDFGIDYYTLTDRAVYQCYAVEEPCEVALRADKQIAKITADLRKFCAAKPELQAILQGTRVRNWVLLVPLHDSSKVNGHTTRKTHEVRALNLNYAAQDFEVLIQDSDSFDLGSRATRLLALRTVSVPIRSISPEEVDDWSSASEPLVQALSRKLRKRVSAGDDVALEKLMREAIQWFLEKENALESLRSVLPELYEQIQGIIARRVERLALYGPPASGEAHAILRSELEGLIGELTSVIPNFSSQSAHQMALGAVAEWLMRCPLDFPPYDHAFRS